jgi:hypothetical protein
MGRGRVGMRRRVGEEERWRDRGAQASFDSKASSPPSWLLLPNHHRSTNPCPDRARFIMLLQHDHNALLCINCHLTNMRA